MTQLDWYRGYGRGLVLTSSNWQSGLFLCYAGLKTDSSACAEVYRHSFVEVERLETWIVTCKCFRFYDCSCRCVFDRILLLL